MRDYGKVAATFWTRGSGRALRGDHKAQLIAIYLMTCQASNMIGLYFIPIPTICHDVGGVTHDEALAALAKIADAGIAHYDPETDLVWIPNMASRQIGDHLVRTDKRWKAVAREFSLVGKHRFSKEFFNRYCLAFDLPRPAWIALPIEGPSHGASMDHMKGHTKPHRSQDQEQEQEQDQIPPSGGAGGHDVRPANKRGSRLAPDWQPQPATVEKFRREFGVDATAIVEEFVDYWLAAPGAKGVKLDWEATFRNWVRRAHERGQVPRYVAPKPRPTRVRNPFTGELEPYVDPDATPVEDQPSGVYPSDAMPDCGAGTGPLTLFGGCEPTLGPPDASEGILEAAAGGRRRG